MRRRKFIVTIVALLCLGGFAAWRLVHRCDPRLAGRWLVMFGQPATEEQLREASGRVSGLARANWTLHGDGTGRENFSYLLMTLPLQLSTDGTIRMQHMSTPTNGRQSCRWWTEEDRLVIDWGSAATGWYWMRAIAFDLLSGAKRSSHVEEYSYAVEQPNVIRIESHAKGEQVYYMTRISE